MSRASINTTRNRVVPPVCLLLRARAPGVIGAKLLARDIDRSHRTVQGWTTGRTQPRAEDVVTIMAARPDLRADLLRLADARAEELNQRKGIRK